MLLPNNVEINLDIYRWKDLYRLPEDYCMAVFEIFFRKLRIEENNYKFYIDKKNFVLIQAEDTNTMIMKLCLFLNDKFEGKYITQTKAEELLV